ncbi:MAG: hypothetical protein RMA76_23930 [Deltaproteobacteria bacterium]
MSDYGRLGPRIREKILERSPEQGDVHEAIEAFANDVGARLLLSEGAGEVAVLIPESDAYEAPKRLEISNRDSGALIDAVPRSGSVQIEGVGRFSRYVVEPHRLEKAAGKDVALGIRGEDWSPLGFDGWFFEDLRMWVDLARRDEGLEVRSELDPEPDGETWMRLEADQRSALENVLRRVLPDVVHRSVLDEAQALAKEANGAFDAALDSIALTLGSSAPVEPELGAPATLDAAAPVLESLFGAGVLDPDATPPKGLLELAADLLKERGLEAAPVRLALRGDAVDRADLDAALERAMGRRFVTDREMTTSLVDAIIDRHGEAMSFADVEVLRDLRVELEERAQVELLGPQVADRTLPTASADKALDDLMKHLKGGTGVDDAALFTLASKVQGAVNAPRGRPHVVVVAGDLGPGANEVLDRAMELVGPDAVKLAGDEMRLFDPVGYLTGSPMGEHGAAPSRLVADGGRLVARIDGLEKIGAQLPDEAQRERTAESFFGFVSHLEREGWYRPADGKGANTPDGRMQLEGGMLVLTTSDSPKALSAKMSDDVWAQLAPHVVELKTSDATRLADEIATQVRRAVMDAGEYPDAQVEIGDRARAMIRDLADAGMKPSVLSQTLIDFLVERVAYAALDGALSPKLRIDLHRGLTSKERKTVVDAWGEGTFPSLAGIGGCPLVLLDEGHFEGQAKAFDPKIRVRGDHVDPRLQVAEYQVALAASNRDNKELLSANQRLAEWLDAAETRISDLGYVNTRQKAEIKDLVRLNKIAEETIASLQSDLTEANVRIEGLNADLKKAKDAAEEIRAALKTAESERDEIYKTLRQTEDEFSDAVREVAGSADTRDPNAVLSQVIATGLTRNRFRDGLTEQLFMIATSQALERSGVFARSFNKWGEITKLAKNYVLACAALDRPVDGRILNGFERAARLSGNGRERNLAQAWERDVGLPSGYAGRDPNMLTHSIRQLARLGLIRL